MGITRNGPVLNMDNNEPLRLLGPTQRFTRAQAHRLLKMNNIKHDQSAPMDHLLYLIQMNNLPIMIPPAGRIFKEEPPREYKVETKLTLVSNNGLPNNVPKLRALCKEKGIKFKLTDNKETLYQRINEHLKNVKDIA